ncbi:MAG: hypothetical protein JWO32_2551 [Bacteroidetes bacterium]|nr:hypothetical protein [Bacteroidota bacterium]
MKLSSEIVLKNKEDFKEREEHFMSFQYFVESYVRHILIYLNIARPGAFETRKGFIKSNETISESKIKISDFNQLMTSLNYSIEIAKKYKWPQLKELPIKKTLDWLDLQWKAFEVISASRIQRALNAFSYIFHDNANDNSPNDLFHALMGIEAVYVQGNSSIQDQVNLKSQLLLGKRDEFKKTFNELYDYRSRYIHGQLNFINKYFVDDKSDAIDHLLKTYEKSAFAIAILIATIQKHVEFDKTEIEFELKIKN